MARTIRQATVGDAPSLAQAEREIAQTPGLLASRPHEIADAKLAAKIAELQDSETGRFLVVEDDGALVAHGLLDPLQLDVTRHVVALTIAVHHGSQGRGIGREVLSALIAWARQAPRVEKIELRVRSGNDRAIGLYRALGFVEEGRLVKRIKLGPTSSSTTSRWGCGSVTDGYRTQAGTKRLSPSSTLRSCARSRLQKHSVSASRR